jgi:tetratricopeptide (TPR) repeat protein
MILSVVTISFAEDKKTEKTGDEKVLEQNQAEKLYQEGWYKETALNDFEGAIKIYQKIVEEYSQDKTVSPKALFQMGGCYEKLGKHYREVAISAYQMIINCYPDQKELVDKAKTKLSEFNQSESLESDKTITRTEMTIKKEDKKFDLIEPYFTAGYLYTNFTNKLHLDNNAGFRIKVGLLKSDIFLEYQQINTNLKYSANKDDVRIQTFQIGTYPLGEIFSIKAGLQKYEGTKPNDTAPVISFGLGFGLPFSKDIYVGPSWIHDIVWTNANQSSTHRRDNNSFTLSMGIKF